MLSLLKQVRRVWLKALLLFARGERSGVASGFVSMDSRESEAETLVFLLVRLTHVLGTHTHLSRCILVVSNRQSFASFTFDVEEESDDCCAPNVSRQTSAVSYCPQNSNSEPRYMYSFPV